MASRGINGVMQNISNCSKELAEWNSVSFGSIRRNIASVQDKLDKLLVRGPLGLHQEELKLAHHEVQKWLEIEEKLW